MNAVEREPVETRVLNPTVSEASYKKKQRSYRKMNLKKKGLAPDSPGAEMSSAETYPPLIKWPFLGTLNPRGQGVQPCELRDPSHVHQFSFWRIISYQNYPINLQKLKNVNPKFQYFCCGYIQVL